MRNALGQFKRVSLEDKLAARIVKTDSCWQWIGRVDHTGYGRLHINDNGKTRTRSAHKVVYEELIGPVPPGMQLDHVCHDPDVCKNKCPHRLCVNPAHLQLVTPRQNVLRSNGLAAINAAKTECVNGHPFIESNTYYRPDNGSRRCKQCRAIATEKYQQKRK